MTHEQHDGSAHERLLEACLEEVIQGQSPPDLSDQIMAAWLAKLTAPTATPAQPAAAAPAAPAPAVPVPVVSAPLSPVPVPAPHAAPIAKNGHAAQATAAPNVPKRASAKQPVPGPAPSADAIVAASLAGASRRRLFRRLAQVGAVAACLLLCVGGVIAWQRNRPDSVAIGHQEEQTTDPATGADLAGSDRVAAGDSPRAGLTAEEAQAARRRVEAAQLGISVEELDRREAARREQAEKDRVAREQKAAEYKQKAALASKNVGSSDVLGSATTPDAATANSSSANSSSATGAISSTDDDVIAYINALIRRGWDAAGVKPSDAATDGEWIRRLFLDILGRIPTSEETIRFTNDKSKEKRARLVAQLLDSDEYIEEYARNWTTLWTNILIGRDGGMEQNSMVSRAGLQAYLRRTLLNNRPYDRMVAELISADGSNTPGADDFNGAVNFLLHNLNENATPATAKTARIFLGVQVQCTQCHNHPFNDWKQDRFWEMNSFFRQARGQRIGGERNAARLVDVDFFGEGAKNPAEAEIYYELRNGLLKIAYPKFIDGTTIDPSGLVANVNRRDELARLVTASPMMAQAQVNRIWSHFLGYGFTKPIDDMGTHNSPSHPELMERLARDFSGHGYDVKQLIRWIVLSEPYALSSRVHSKNEKDDPLAGERPLFSHFYLRQMRAEELYQSLLVATRADRAIAGDYEEQEQRRAQWLRQFTVAFGTDEKDEGTTFNGTIPQTLMMWNGELIQKATAGESGTFIDKLAKGKLKNDAMLNQLFLTAYSRRPAGKEVQFANAMWQARGGDTVGALQDVWWVILNTNEFILNH